MEHTIIRPDHSTWNQLNFVISARSRDEERPIRQDLQVTQDGACIRYLATDEKRLHTSRITNNALKLGLYSVEAYEDAIILTRNDDDGKFPDWSKYKDFLHISGSRYYYLTERSIGEVLLRTRLLFDFKLLCDAIGYKRPREGFRTKFEASPDHNCVTIEHDQGAAIVMALRYNEQEAGGDQ